MHCVVAAGGVPNPNHVLYPYTNGKPTATIDLGGRPMLEWVVDALLGSKNVDDVIVVGIDDEQEQADFKFKQAVRYLPNHGSMIKNFKAGLVQVSKDDPEAQYVLLCSCDLPQISPQIVDHFIELCQPFEYLFYYPYVEKSVIEKRYPTSNRDYEAWSTGEFLAGDIFVVNIKVLETNANLWDAWDNGGWNGYPDLEAKVIERLGSEVWQKLVEEQLSYEEEASIMPALFGHDKFFNIVYSPYAELAMDTDEPHIIEIVRAEYASQSKLDR